MMSPKDTSLKEEEVADVVKQNKMESNRRECRILLSRPKLCLTTFYNSGVYGTHEGEGVGREKRDGKVA